MQVQMKDLGVYSYYSWKELSWGQQFAPAWLIATSSYHIGKFIHLGGGFVRSSDFCRFTSASLVKCFNVLNTVSYGW